MKGLIALAALTALSGCASMMKAPEPATPWTHWVCDSKAEIYWKYVDAAQKEVDVRLNQSRYSGYRQRPELPARSTATAYWRSTTKAAKAWCTGTLPTI
jgi:hypothetical protein